MSRKKLGGMTIVQCDAKDCPPEYGGEFRSASDPKAKIKGTNLIEIQLQNAGWTVLEMETAGYGSPKVKKYLCPEHKPKGRMSGGPPLMSVTGRSSH